MTYNKLQMAEWHTIENLLSSGASFLEPVVGISNCAIAFDLNFHRFSAEIPVNSDDLPKTLPKFLAFDINQISGMKKLVISCVSSELFRSFYDFIHEVLELVHSGELLPNDAVDEAWSKWGQLIERESSLSREKQVGLIGEIWCLERIAKVHGWEFALDAWHKTSISEHDFCLRSTDIEVKTTTNELRTHMIGSLNQLQPSHGRELFLLSIQITSSSMMANNSFSLASSVRSIEDSLRDKASNLEKFKLRLEQVGWQENHMNFYDATYIMRSKSRFLKVDDNCPRIIDSTLIGLTDEIRARIGSVSYRIDVTGLGIEEEDASFEKVFMG
jgi:hypothetical protein